MAAPGAGRAAGADRIAAGAHSSALPVQQPQQHRRTGGERSGKAEQAVLDLSDLFRASLARPGTLVAWRDELELSRRYLSIEQYRLGDRLQMDWRVDGVPDDLPIPQLTLQPLLENALVYGIQPRIEGAWSA